MRDPEQEKQRLTSLLFDCGVPEKKISMLEPVIDNVAWMRGKLDAARDAVKNSNVVIPYDNGGGQTGIRENPIYKGYESLWKSYMSGLEKILACLPADVARDQETEVDAPKTVLQLVRSKHKKEA